MSRLAASLREIAIVLWAGGLWTVGYLAPALFGVLDDRALAATLAGRMFHLISWVGVGCGGYLLLHDLGCFGSRALRRGSFWLAALMLAVSLTQLFWLQPLIAGLRSLGAQVGALAAPSRRFAFWHGASSALYLIQSVLAVALVLIARRR